MSENVSPISVVQQLHRLDLFFVTSRTLADLFGLSPSQGHRIIAQLKDQGLLIEVENGKFLVLGFEPERVLANPLFIASQLVTPGYVSFWSALHYYGFTEQVPRTIFVATTKKKRPLVFRDTRFRFVTVQPRKLFGYRREIIGGLPVLMADEAKALIDSLAEPRYAGGMAEVAKALQAALLQIDTAQLVEYANRMRDKSLGSRLGFLLARLGHDVAAGDLIYSASRVKLDPGRPVNGRWDDVWRVDVNLADSEMFPAGVE